MKIYTVTKSYNDYNQYGSYLVAAFKEYPTMQQLLDLDLGEKIANNLFSTGKHHDKYDDWISYEIEEVPLL